MTTLSEIRLCSEIEFQNRFKKNLNVRPRTNQHIWLIKGDFDHVKAFNDVYGREIVDLLLDWAIDRVIEVIAGFQTAHRLRGIDIAIAGDDMTVSIPFCSLTEHCIITLLCKIRDDVKQYFTNRFVVACIKNIDQIIRKLPWPELQRLKKNLGQHRVFLDQAWGRKGCKVLAPLLNSSETSLEALKRIAQVIKKEFPAPTERELHASFDWLFSSKTEMFETFNSGIVWPMSISLGAVSNNDFVKEFSKLKSSEVFEKMSAICQYNLQRAKAKGSSISVNEPIPETSQSDRENGKIVIPASDMNKTRVPLASERYLRQVISKNMTEDSQGLLLKLEPVYVFETTETRRNISIMSKFRGNQYGIGIKGVNTLCGQEIGSQMIIRLIFSISDALRGLCHSKGLPGDMIHVAVFVDTFTIYFQESILTTGEIVRFICNIMNIFNKNIQGIKLSHLTVSTVRNAEGTNGDALLHQLENTSLAKNSPNILHQNDTVLVKGYSPGVKDEGEQIMEELVYQNACLLCNES